MSVYYLCGEKELHKTDSRFFYAERGLLIFGIFGVSFYKNSLFSRRNRKEIYIFVNKRRFKKISLLFCCKHIKYLSSIRDQHTKKSFVKMMDKICSNYWLEERFV